MKVRINDKPLNESNLSSLRSEIDNLQLKHPNPITGDDVINNDSPGDDREIPNLSISSQISRCVNDRFERANVIVFNLKKHENKVEDDKLVESLILFIIGHNRTFNCTRLGKKEESVTRPVKIKFHHLSVNAPLK